MKSKNFQKIADSTPPEIEQKVSDWVKQMDKEYEAGNLDAIMTLVCTLDKANELLLKTWNNWCGDDYSEVQSTMKAIEEYLKKYKVIT